MTEQDALSRMVAPGQRRAGKPRGGVIQILVTSSCDKACVSCTQTSQAARKPWFMSLEQFEQACRSLAGYWGVKGLFGGNPATSPHFLGYCEILRKHFGKDECGIWCNNPIDERRARAMRETFSPAVSNLNVHLDVEADRRFREWWPESRPFGLTQESRHSPVLVSMRDVGVSEGERWRLISECDINKHWSAGIGVFRGELRAWFCEIAMAQSILHQDEPDYPDTGVSPLITYSPLGVDTPGPCRWWELPMRSHPFREQVRRHCHDCGVPLRGRGELSQSPDGAEQVSAAHAGAFRPKQKSRRVELVTTREQLGSPLAMTTDYLGNSRR